MIGRKYITIIFIALFLFASCNRTKQIKFLDQINIFAKEDYVAELPQYAEWINVDNKHSIKDFRGKLVLINFWTYGCINSLLAIPEIKKLEEKYPELIVIGVHSARFLAEKSTQNISEAVIKYGIDYPVINDYKFELWNNYRIKSWPSFVLVDHEGVVVDVFNGLNNFTRLDEIINGIIEAPKKSIGLNHKRVKFNLIKENLPTSIMSFPGKLEVDNKHNKLFISCANNYIIVTDPNGNIIDKIGSGQIGKSDGSFDTACFNGPQGMAYDSTRNVLYIADSKNNIIRLADMNTRTVITVLRADKQALWTGLSNGNSKKNIINAPWDIELFKGDLIITMAGANQIWQMDTTICNAKVIVGSGFQKYQEGDPLKTLITQPFGITGSSNTIYFSDSKASAIKKYYNNKLTTVTGGGLFDYGDIDGPCHLAKYQHPLGVLYHNEKLYISDTYNNKIKVLDLREVNVRTLIGTGFQGFKDGNRTEAKLNEPHDIEFLNGKFYITDTNNDLIRIYDPETDSVTTMELKLLNVLNPTGNNFQGEIILLDTVHLKKGKCIIEFTIEPYGLFEIYKHFPGTLQLVSENEMIYYTEQIIKMKGKFKYLIELSTNNGVGIFSFNASVYYNRKNKRANSFYRNLIFKVPFKISHEGNSIAHINYKIK